MDEDFDDFDESDDIDRDFDDDGEELSSAAPDDDLGSDLSDDDIALGAFMDGQMDAELAGFPYGGYGISVDDENKLTDAQKELYDTEYLAGYEDQQIRDELDGTEDNL